jgi:hypothetical protein
LEAATINFILHSFQRPGIVLRTILVLFLPRRLAERDCVVVLPRMMQYQIVESGVMGFHSRAKHTQSLVELRPAVTCTTQTGADTCGDAIMSQLAARSHRQNCDVRRSCTTPHGRPPSRCHRSVGYPSRPRERPSRGLTGGHGHSRIDTNDRSGLTLSRSAGE